LEENVVVYEKVIEIQVDPTRQRVVVNWFPEYSREEVLELLAKAIAEVQVIERIPVGSRK